MKFKIIGTGGEYFSVNKNIPPELSAFYLPGANVISASDTFGAFLVQFIELDGFCWRYSVYHIKEDISFEISALISLPVCKIVLEGSVQFRIENIAGFILKNGEFNFLNHSPLRQQLHFTKRGQHVLLDLFFPAEYLLYALRYYPALQQFAEKVNSHQPALLSDKNMYADADMLNMVHTLIHLPYSLTVKKFHLDLLKRLLFKSLRLNVLNSSHPLKFSLQQVEAIERAKQFIDMHLPNHFSIPQIARRAGLNEQILKTGFKEIFGMGLYSYLQEQVFIIAKKQLEETNKSVKEIAFEAGYRSANNFSAAFKKRFTISPLEWRKKFR